MSAPATTGQRLRVLIAGGGFAGLEAVLALRELAGERVEISLMAPGSELIYRPVTVAEAFGRAQARSFRIAEILADHDVAFLRDTVRKVDPAAHTVVTTAGTEIPYDALVIATGAVMTAPLTGALTFRGRNDVEPLKAMLRDLVDGTAKSVAFTLPRGQTWPLPLYELTMLTASHLREHGSSAQVHLVTPEEGPLALFGSAAEEAIRPMLTALGVRIRSQSMPAAVKEHELVLVGGGGIRVDRVITLPELVGPRIEGLPADEHGFIPVDSHGRVHDVSDVYAAGDVTAFPLKQGGLATQEADAVAESIAAKAGAPIRPRRFHPVLRGLLITAGAPLYLRCEPQRLERHTSVAINARRPPHSLPGTSEASDQALWWPPAKIAGRYLAPYLATARPSALTSEPLADRGAIAGPAIDEDEFEDAVELALLLADGDADWGDYHSALAALDAAEALRGALPPDYEAKRQMWLAEIERQ
ncbi:MAG: NAD(P)/FAD-dependent oxidoreductase [Solirubrobacteraceae bacterium]